MTRSDDIAEDTVGEDTASEDRAEWLAHMARIGADHGFFDRIGEAHLALFVQEGDTLLVSFDTTETARTTRPGGMPLGFAAVQARQVSFLSVMAEGETWFRDPDLFAFFNTLRDQGFFESFARVVVLGLGPMAGHAACVFSSVVPGATVITAHPAATLAPDLAGFDDRFRAKRRLDFDGPFGDAAALVRGAERVLLFHDPYAPVDAAHAAQFRGETILRIPLRFRGKMVERLVADPVLLVPLLRSIDAGDLTAERVFEFLRPVRRGDAESLLHLTLRAARAGQAGRAAILASAAKRAQQESGRRTASALMERGAEQPARATAAAE